ncbi:short chain dehydrogenase [Rheinheimera sp. SA_1]|uniref:SDR family oxidoreductase n=1 Tax=Rheinheimera sp. SA_1 TaxID=1827365 RepID=UPI0008009732|nr:SDR family oxidoreductase [Rheinheimera sp. SA_1]OBP14472.1 short chain dehydrogenase [Rheinheimera sp. SA_1]
MNSAIAANHQLAGKRVLLTGATGGIGRAVARRLAAAGASVLFVARQPAELLLLSQQLPGTHSCFSADLTATEELKALADFVKATGGIDVLINNAGTSQFALTAEQDYAAQMSLNLLAPMQLCQLLLPELSQRTAATIVNIGSAFGSIGYPGFSGYCASKFGLRGFTEALKREVSSKALRVLYFAPRATQTAINSAAVVAMNQELGNAMDKPDDVAAELMQQLQTGQSRWYIGWPEKFFVRLNALLPELVDRAIGGKRAVIRTYAAGSTDSVQIQNNLSNSAEKITATRS